MKLNRLETHDRYEKFMGQSFDISECCKDLIDQRPFGDHPFYIFVHSRTDDNGYNKRIIWSPWIWKPRAQTNSMLFKAYPGTDMIKKIWNLPVRELWEQYKKDKLFADEFIYDSIIKFETNKHLLENPESDDPSAELAQEIAFEYQPQLYKRDSLPPNKRHIWDAKMHEREVKKAMKDLII